MTGSEVTKEAMKRCTVDASVSYPITPQSEAAHLIGELWAEGYVGTYFRGENEFGVMSEVAGCAMAGARTVTTTSGYRYTKSNGKFSNVVRYKNPMSTYFDG